MRRSAALFIALILSAAFALHANGQEKDARDLLPILLKGKLGFIDETGGLSSRRSLLRRAVSPKVSRPSRWAISGASSTLPDNKGK